MDHQIMQLTASGNLPEPNINSDLFYITIAREIAIDHYPIEEILERYRISPENFQKMSKSKRFVEILAHEIQEWQGAKNTPERVKLKTAAILENWLEEANRSLLDSNLPLNHRTELGKFIGKLAGMGLDNATINTNMGERFVVNINLGNDHQIKIEKQATIQNIIDGEAIDQ